MNFDFEANMAELSDALKALKNVHGKFGLPGTFISGGRAVSYWPVAIPISAELIEFYNECEPENVKFETGLTPLKLVGLDQLKGAQVGYRWSNTRSGHVLNPGWPQEYVVVMDDSGGGKPIVAVTDEAGTPVYASYDTLSPFKIAESMADFLLALAKLTEIVYGEYNVFDVFDDDGVVDGFMERLEEDILPIVGLDNFNRFVDYFYG
ncbi:hypothetical protein [Pseudomonas soli]|uniref:hypothetical protein n=1 Tax=Pseudomonas soli TaxID=1306993 RepID=UPI00345CF157